MGLKSHFPPLGREIGRLLDADFPTEITPNG
jgi:hypothetical protein